jgi:hypothetical protein
VGWDKIAAKLGIKKRQARYRFKTYEAGLDEYYRLIRMEIKEKSIEIIPAYTRCQTGTDTGTSKGGRGNKNPEVQALADREGISYQAAKKRLQRAKP